MVESVQITMAENFGIQGRGGFYDATGAVRDVIQNHLFQLLSNLAMEPPARMDSESMRDEKVKVLKSIPRARSRRISCADSSAAIARSPASRPTRDVETYAAVRLSHRFVALAGRAVLHPRRQILPVTCTEVVVRLRQPPTMFPTAVPMPNYFRFRIMPDQTVAFGVTAMDDADQMIGQRAELVASRQPRRRRDGRLRARPWRRARGRRHVVCADGLRRRGVAHCRSAADDGRAGARVRARHVGARASRRRRRPAGRMGGSHHPREHAHA